jgi:hypothetical protein
MAGSAAILAIPHLLAALSAELASEAENSF